MVPEEHHAADRVVEPGLYIVAVCGRPDERAGRDLDGLHALVVVEQSAAVRFEDLVDVDEFQW